MNEIFKHIYILSIYFILHVIYIDCQVLILLPKLYCNSKARYGCLCVCFVVLFPYMGPYILYVCFVNTMQLLWFSLTKLYQCTCFVCQPLILVEDQSLNLILTVRLSTKMCGPSQIRLTILFIYLFFKDTPFTHMGNYYNQLF